MLFVRLGGLAPARPIIHSCSIVHMTLHNYVYNYVYNY